MDELKAAYNLMDERLDGQEIVSDEQLREGLRRVRDQNYPSHPSTPLCKDILEENVRDEGVCHTGSCPQRDIHKKNRWNSDSKLGVRMDWPRAARISSKVQKRPPSSSSAEGVTGPS